MNPHAIASRQTRGLAQLAAGAIAFVLAATAALPARAQYPDRPIRFVVAAGAGSTADILARTYADKLKTLLGQPIVVDNKPGANTSIGSDAIAKAPGDGYTFGLTSSAMVINPWITKPPFHFAKDLVPVAKTGETPYLVTINGQLPVNNLDEFIAYARSNPGKLSCGTYGIGSPPHLALELLKKAAGVNIQHIPYKSTANAIPELLSGQLACVVEPPPGTVAQIRAGRLRVIAHTGDRPMAAFPGVEPIGRKYQSATVVGWQAIFAPSSTPRPALERLRAEWARVLATPEIEQKLRESGFEPARGSVDEFAKSMEADHERFGAVIREAGIKLE